MENESSIKQIINSSLEQIRTIVDADTVVGKPIDTASGTVIIPISKVSMGFATGGLDIPNDRSYGAGGGTGVTVSPIGFLTVYSDGRVEMLPLVQEKASPVEQVADLLDHAPDIINRIKSALDSFEFGDCDEDEETALEEEYDLLLQEDPEAEDLSPRELKKRRRQMEKEAKKAAKAKKK